MSEEINKIAPLAIDMVIDIVTCDLEDNLTKVAELMISHQVDSILVINSNKPVGIITEGVIVKLISEGKNPCEFIAKDVMVSSIYSVFSNDRVFDIASQFERTTINRLCVVDDDGNLIGIISKKSFDEFQNCLLSFKKRRKKSKS
ncbi:CBS domain-containing protein [Candidatus Borrarchaeum sp.]|uniref:CBS domain-containing protein n=1 Tax=Candidatus Borrarchaeum sp. TaxID=2846742 RepID=UPI00257EC581|nr:CBS domain-containing protein [Candidatus Borrarchaeum sp.]